MPPTLPWWREDLLKFAYDRGDEEQFLKSLLRSLSERYFSEPGFRSAEGDWRETLALLLLLVLRRSFPLKELLLLPVGIAVTDDSSYSGIVGETIGLVLRPPVVRSEEDDDGGSPSLPRVKAKLRRGRRSSDTGGSDGDDGFVTITSGASFVDARDGSNSIV